MCASFLFTTIYWTEMRIENRVVHCLITATNVCKRLFSILLDYFLFTPCICFRFVRIEIATISSNYKTLALQLNEWKSNEASEKRIQVNSFHHRMERNRKFYDETRIHTKLTLRIVTMRMCVHRTNYYSFRLHTTDCRHHDMLNEYDGGTKKFTRYFCHSLNAFSSHCVNLLQCIAQQTVFSYMRSFTRDRSAVSIAICVGLLIARRNYRRFEDTA